MNNNNNCNIKLIMSYNNAYILKTEILRDNKNKSGVYRRVNTVNGKSYVGSSKCLYKRLHRYYSTTFLNTEINRRSSIIYNALLKYGYFMFKLDIVEYCESNILLEREQYYMDLLKPEYNILRIAGSILGVKHSLKTKKLIVDSLSDPLKKFLPIKVTDINTNIIIHFATSLEAARYLKVSKSTIIRYKSKKKYV